jgi:hypothetical protein
MSNQVNVADLLQNLLDDRYADGYATGNETGYAAGREAGYAQAMCEIRDMVLARLNGSIEQAGPSPASTGAGLADHPGDENDTEADEAEPPMIVGLQPNFRRALEYLKQHPGATSHEARDVVRNRNAFRALHLLGLVEKRGAQFFPKNAEVPR